MRNFIFTTIAVLSIVLLLASFMFGGQLQNLLMKAPFMKVDPIFSGGEIEKVVENESYTITIKEKQFPALIGESDEGFRQIEITCSDSTICNYNISQINIDSLYDFKVENDEPILIDSNSNETKIAGSKSNKSLIFRIFYSK